MMGRPKAKTKAQSAAIDREIDRLSLCGHTHQDIADRLGISQSAVTQRIKKINARVNLNREAHLTAEVLRSEYRQQEALNAWNASKEQHETVTVERKDGKDRVTKRVERQPGNPAFLEASRRESERLAKLLGLDAPTNVANTITGAMAISLFTDALNTAYADSDSSTDAD